MPEMSASAQDSGLAVAIDADRGAPAASAAHPPVAAATLPLPEITQHSATVPVVRPAWRLAAAGYTLLVLGTFFACFIPHLHLHARIGEEALVLLDILALVLSTGLIITSFVRSILRQL
jgi:hypothetical protein